MPLLVNIMTIGEFNEPIAYGRREFMQRPLELIANVSQTLGDGDTHQGEIRHVGQNNYHRRNILGFLCSLGFYEGGKYILNTLGFNITEGVTYANAESALRPSGTIDQDSKDLAQWLKDHGKKAVTQGLLGTGSSIEYTADILIDGKKYELSYNDKDENPTVMYHPDNRIGATDTLEILIGKTRAIGRLSGKLVYHDEIPNIDYSIRDNMQELMSKTDKDGDLTLEIKKEFLKLRGAWQSEMIKAQDWYIQQIKLLNKHLGI